MPLLPQLEERSIPSLEELKSGFKNILSTDVSGMGYEKVKKLFIQELKLFPSWLTHPEKNLNEKGLNLFRVRKANDVDLSSHTDTTSIKTFSYPPSHCTKMNRANIANYPVFYGANSPPTAIFELGILPNEEFYLSEWHFNTNNSRLNLILTIPEDKNSIWNKLTLNTEAKLNNVNRDYNHNSRKSLNYLIRQFSELFLIDKYELTSTIGHHALYESRTDSPYFADAIVYPSLRSSYDSANFAIHPSLIGKAVTPQYLYKAILLGIEQDGVNLHFQSIGQIINDQIEWFNPTYRINETTIVAKNNEARFNISTQKMQQMKLSINSKIVPFQEFISSHIGMNIQELCKDAAIEKSITPNLVLNRSLTIRLKDDLIACSTDKGHFLFIKEIIIELNVFFKSSPSSTPSLLT